MTHSTPLWTVYAFEFFCIASLVVIFAIIARRYRDDQVVRWHLYAVLAGCLLSFIWEWYQDIGPLQLGYDHRFHNLWTLHGVSLPMCMPLAYGWYWAIPLLLLLPMSGRLQQRFGRWQYLVVFVVTGVYNVLVEYPATTFISLWNYFWDQNSGWTLGGMPITNGPAAGTSSLLMYIFCLYIWNRRDQDTADVVSDGASLRGYIDQDNGTPHAATVATPTAQRQAPATLKNLATLSLMYAAAIALAFQLSWTIWTPLLGWAMPAWFNGGAGGWIHSGG